MSVYRIRRRLDSETLHLPELKPLLGKNVEIIVLEDQPQGVIPGSGDWDSAARAAQELRNTGYDFDAWSEQRDYDLKHAADHSQ